MEAKAGSHVTKRQVRKISEGFVDFISFHVGFHGNSVPSVHLATFTSSPTSPALFLPATSPYQSRAGSSEW
ncbi:hypothetical protein O3P69_002027 [Scylla paramamosain]|uniref:Uncharacterized protein n=1 Tax=Scylla paramamosain TaxID=85552 RepID=A0AAW0V574_SCYPA